jgi:hypothetical protein
MGDRRDGRNNHVNNVWAWNGLDIKRVFQTHTEGPHLSLTSLKERGGVITAQGAGGTKERNGLYSAPSISPLTTSVTPRSSPCALGDGDLQF